jgi:hypothetical protein
VDPDGTEELPRGQVSAAWQVKVWNLLYLVGSIRSSDHMRAGLPALVQQLTLSLEHFINLQHPVHVRADHVKNIPGMISDLVEASQGPDAMHEKIACAIDALLDAWLGDVSRHGHLTPK